MDISFGKVEWYYTAFKNGKVYYMWKYGKNVAWLCDCKRQNGFR